MNNNENYARNFILFTVLVIVLFFGYKYYEYRTIKDFIVFQNQSEDKEYRATEKNGQLSEKISPIFNDFYGIGETNTSKKVSKTDSEAFIYSYNLSNDLINLEKIITEANRDYSNLIKNNEQTYNNFDKKFSVLFTPQGRLFKEYIRYQKYYYDDEFKNSINNVISDNFTQNYTQVLQDRLVLANFVRITKGKTKDFISNNFGSISPLEKYTRNDYKFIDEENIKVKKPYGFELLDKNRKYMAAYYELIKEYIYGDTESYKYKYEKFNTISSDFNIDLNKVFSEGETEGIESSKRILENVYGKFLISKKINNILNKYSIYGKYGVLSSDLSMCQSYEYRYSLFGNMNGKYPIGNTIDELISEFDGINLSDKEADSLFNKSSLIFTNSKDKAIFECVDQDTKQKYTFSVSK